MIVKEKNVPVLFHQPFKLMDRALLHFLTSLSSSAGSWNVEMPDEQVLTKSCWFVAGGVGRAS
jgi:hypothetical protein